MDFGKIPGRRPDAVLHLQGMLSPSECHWSVITVGGCLQLFILIDERLGGRVSASRGIDCTLPYYLPSDSEAQSQPYLTTYPQSQNSEAASSSTRNLAIVSEKILVWYFLSSSTKTSMCSEIGKSELALIFVSKEESKNFFWLTESKYM